ncbi:hypothetical protein [Enterococcus sp. AZ126]|uniref:hypothetical protein n=1 Tax=Enterococcus sp. AZ126 TaxID=2774635 RepID=UPI003F227A80
MNCSEFYNKYCTTTKKKDIVLFSCRNNQLQINKNESERQYLELNIIFRYVNPKVCMTADHISEEKLNDDFDLAIKYLTDNKFEKLELDVDNKEVYFLPSDLERILKDVLHNNKTKKVSSEIEKFIPNELLKKKSIEFKELESKIVEYENIGKYSVSFFKIFDSKNEESDVEKTKLKLKQIKDELHAKFIGEFDYCYIGNIPKNFGFIERNLKCQFPDPLTFHYNFWELPNYSFEKLFENFELEEI